MCAPSDLSRPRIKDWPKAERPREKLLTNGPSVLTDSELLAILIRSGTGGLNALELARKILVQEGSLGGLALRSPEELIRIRGIGLVRAVELIAAFEVGRRIGKEDRTTGVLIRSPEDVSSLMCPLLRDAPNERFHVLVLNSMNRLIRNVELTSGTLNASLVHPREVFKAAIDHRGASVVVVHNHPSGNAEPSREDIEVTRQLADAGKIVGIPLHDHVIIAGNRYSSLAEEGYC